MSDDIDFDKARSALQNLQEQLQRAIEEADTASEVVILDQTSVGRVSRVDALQQQAMAQAAARNLRTRRAQVEAALKRIDDNTYGDCLRCEEPIGIDRLTARPEAPFCLACQTQTEARSR